jgi:4-amino-4-deoxy-L-arabinose transferase-like glycosyltransferase
MTADRFKNRDWSEVALVASMFALALVVRLIALHTIPPGLYNDEAAYGMDALSVLDGQHAVFFERNNGREPLFIYLLSFVFRLAGATPYTIRLTAAICGALTVVTTYWLVRESYRFLAPCNDYPLRWHAGWVGFFLAFSYWHVTFSRLGFRAITLPLVMTLAFVFFWRAWRRLRDEPRLPWLDLLLTGFFLGLVFYTYSAGRMAIVLFGLIAAFTFLLAARLGMKRRAILSASAVVLVVTLIVVAPLAGYFISHPASFGSRAAAVSIFSQEFAGDDPLAALANSIAKTALMFVSEPDPNLRHNPAQRPVFDPMLGIWFLTGLLVAAAQWRNPPQVFFLLWALLLAVPAIFTAEGIPHSLRAIGMIPAAFTLAVGAMLWAGRKFSIRRSRLALWLPLPFFVFSSLVGMADYFGAWQDSERFRNAFLTDYVALSETLAEHGGEDLWLLALSPNYHLSDSRFNTIDFLVRDRAHYATVLMDDQVAPAELSASAEGRRTVNVLHPYLAPELSETSFVFLDTKGLLDFLLRRSGRLLEERDGTDSAGIPYSVYELADNPSFELPTSDQPVDVSFGDSVKLTGMSLGSAGDPAPTTTPRIRSDQPLWAVLRWQAERPIDLDLKTSLLLIDQDGNVAGQFDGLLTGDGYPVERVWQTGEAASSYHILTPLPAIPPGDYTLALKVYEDATQRVYPAHLPGGETGDLAPIASVVVTAPSAPVGVTPQVALTETLLGDDLQLLGYDLPRSSLGPGDRLALTLFWQALRKPSSDFSVLVELRDDSGQVVAAERSQLGGATFPSSDWRAGETLRDWHTLAVDAQTPSGDYQLVVTLLDGDAPVASASLGAVRVEGRTRLLDAPSLSQPVAAIFGDVVRLIGVDAPDGLQLAPGGLLTFTLVWQPTRTEEASLVRFVQVLDGAGQLVAQQDTVPCGGACPASSWLAGEYLLDPVTIALPADLPAGAYRLVTGWYDPASQQRLAGVDAAGQPLADGVLTLPLP